MQEDFFFFWHFRLEDGKCDHFCLVHCTVCRRCTLSRPGTKAAVVSWICTSTCMWVYWHLHFLFSCPITATSNAPAREPNCVFFLDGNVSIFQVSSVFSHLFSDPDPRRPCRPLTGGWRREVLPQSASPPWTSNAIYLNCNVSRPTYSK